MKEIIALQEYTDKYVSLYEGQIRNLTDDIANQLIAKQIVKEHNDQTVGTNLTILIKTDAQGRLINDDGTYVTEQQMRQYKETTNNIEILYKNNFYKRWITNIKYDYDLYVGYSIDNTTKNLTIQCFTLSEQSEITQPEREWFFNYYFIEENSVKKYILEPYTE